MIEEKNLPVQILAIRELKYVKKCMSSISCSNAATFEFSFLTLLNLVTLSLIGSSVLHSGPFRLLYPLADESPWIRMLECSRGPGVEGWGRISVPLSGQILGEIQIPPPHNPSFITLRSSKQLHPFHIHIYIMI